MSQWPPTERAPRSVQYLHQLSQLPADVRPTRQGSEVGPSARFPPLALLHLFRSGNYSRTIVRDKEALRLSLASYDRAPAWYASAFDRVDRQGLARRFLGQRTLVLDAGSGGGADTKALSRLSSVVISLDASAGLLQVHRAHDPTARVVRSDLRQCPFPDNTFDGVWAMASLVHLGETQVAPALSELARVTVTGGLIVASLPQGQGPVWSTDSPGLRRRVLRTTPHDLAQMTAKAAEQGPRLTLVDVTPVSLASQPWLFGRWRVHPAADSGA